MIHWTQHLVVVPVLLPLLTGAAMATLTEGRHGLKFALGYASCLGLLANALALLAMADTGEPSIYFAANWAAPFGIALLADRLAALMLVLTAVLALAALLYAQPRWSRIGVHFHSLFQFLLMGINGAFLTHDLFNLFVFFEVMLAASYGLVLHGYNVARLRASMQFIAVNLATALLFLIGVSMIYAATGTLNMADLARLVPQLPPDRMVLLQPALAVLALAFLVKSAMWPLGFWLPTTYAVASPPVAVMLVLTTKVGAYVILRIWLLVSGEGTSPLPFGSTALLWGGMATIVFGAAGMLATDGAGRMAGFAAIVSSGTLLAVIGHGQPEVVTAALYYYLASTIAIAAFVLLIELVERVERVRTPGAAMLALTMEFYAVEDTPDEPKGRGVPAAMAFLSLAFAACALMIAGLPPLAGFVAKFGIFHALLHPASGSIGAVGWSLMALVLFSSLIAIVALMRFGVRTFWASEIQGPPHLHAAEVAPIAGLLAASVALTIYAQPVFGYIARAGADVLRPGVAIERVLSAPPVPGPAKELP